MSLLELLRVALQALRRNKLRSGLTMLGIIIGVAAVVAMVAVGRGASVAVEASISSLGDNVMMIMPGSFNRSGVRTGFGNWTTLMPDDAVAMARDCPAVALVSPMVRAGSSQVVFEGSNWATSVSGVGVSFLEARKYELSGGRNFTDAEIRGQAKVAILGPAVVDNLFQGNDPIGTVIRIKKLPFTVIGVLKAKGQSTMGIDQDDVVYVPYTTAMRKINGQNHLNMVIASAVSRASVDTARQEITDLLRSRHRIGPDQDDDFIVRTQEDVASTATTATKTMTALLGSIAAVSLLVGGIGIMNIMLVSVTERTREIGLRMAVGAAERDVRIQFLMESVVLSCMGGVVGLALGWGIASLISGLAGWPTHIGAGVMVLSFVFSALVGIFFGWYPAQRAASLDPIDALRYE